MRVRLGNSPEPTPTTFASLSFALFASPSWRAFVPRDRRNPLPSFRNDDMKRVLMWVQLWGSNKNSLSLSLPFSTCPPSIHLSKFNLNTRRSCTVSSVMSREMDELVRCLVDQESYIYIYIQMQKKKKIGWLKLKQELKLSGSKEFSLLFSLNPLIINHVKRKRERECVLLTHRANLREPAMIAVRVNKG